MLTEVDGVLLKLAIMLGVDMYDMPTFVLVEQAEDVGLSVSLTDVVIVRTIDDV